MAGYRTAAAAEAAFYAAFNASDEPAMLALWARRDDIVCVHPLGPRLMGFDAVAASWRQILADTSPRHIDAEVQAVARGETIAIHTVDELISVPGSNARFRPVLATNVYERINGTWFITVHHASIDARSDERSSLGDGSATRH